MSGIARRNGGPSGLRDPRDQRVAEIGDSAFALPVRGKPSSSGRRDRVEVQDSVREIFFEDLLKGALEPETSPSWRKQGQAEPSFE